jgi:hypothetical protein
MKEFLLCIPASWIKQPRAVSESDTCCDCGQKVWRAKSSPKEPKAVCMVCMNKRVKAGEDTKVMPLNREQVQEIVAAGRDDPKQKEFSEKMHKLVSDTIMQCYYEARGIWPTKPPPDSAVNEMILATSTLLGIPQSEAEAREMVRTLCREIGLAKLNLN